MTEDANKEFLRRLFGDKPEPVDNESDNRSPDITMRRFAHRLFNNND